MGGHQGRDTGGGVNRDGMHSYGNPGLWGWAGGAWCWWQHGDMTGDTREGMLEWGSARKECIPIGNPEAVGLGRGCLVLGAAWGHVGWGDTREGMMEWGSTGMECIPIGTLGCGAGQGIPSIGDILGTCGMGGQQ